MMRPSTCCCTGRQLALPGARLAVSDAACTGVGRVTVPVTDWIVLLMSLRT
jgi:hypothetical protein